MFLGEQLKKILTKEMYEYRYAHIRWVYCIQALVLPYIVR